MLKQIFSDTQRLCARWRCWTYFAIEESQPSLHSWQDRFADGVLATLSLIVTSLFGNIPDHCFPKNFRRQLVTIGAESYRWNRSVKSTFKALDFRPVLFTSADPFDPASMTLPLSDMADESPLIGSKIILGATLALMSTQAISSEAGIGEDYVWQTMAEVLTEDIYG
jgi:hypothetical protein